jgi:hypothetical protein
MNTLLLHALNNEPADPILFLPHDGTITGEKAGFPVKLTDVRVANDSISLTVVPLTDAERKELLASIRKPSAKPYAKVSMDDSRAQPRKAAHRTVARPGAGPVVE